MNLVEIFNLELRKYKSELKPYLTEIYYHLTNGGTRDGYQRHLYLPSSMTIISSLINQTIGIKMIAIYCLKY